MKKALILGLMLIGSSQLQGVITTYSTNDKKTFDNIVSVWATKRLGGAKKAQRLEDLQQLTALMMNRLLTYIKYLEPKNINIAKIQNTLNPIIANASGKTSLFNATRYATYGFEKAMSDDLKYITDKGILYTGLSDDEKHILINNHMNKFNDNYKKVINARKELGEQLMLPEQMTYTYLKERFK